MECAFKVFKFLRICMSPSTVSVGKFLPEVLGGSTTIYLRQRYHSQFNSYKMFKICIMIASIYSIH